MPASVMKPSLLLSLTVLTLLPGPSAPAQKTDVRGITRAAYQGWPDAFHCETRDAAPRAVVVPDLGGRVMAYGLRDQNLLWVNPETTGRSFKEGDAPFEPGGFRCDLGPEVGALPPHPALLLGRYEWSSKRRAVLTMRGPEDKTLGAQMGKEISFDPATGDLGFVHRVKNTSERLAAFTFWHRIACQPGGFAFFPLNPKSRFPSGWSMRREEGGRLRYDVESPTSPAVRILDGVLVVQTSGDAPAAKIGADSDGQWLAYALGKTLLIIQFPYYGNAIYSEAGNSVTVSWDGKTTELQPMSPESRLRPGKYYDFPMKWSLVELPAEVTTHEQARALVEKIPSSPFL